MVDKLTKMCVWIVVQRKCFSFTKNMTRSFACGFVKDKNKAGSKNSRWNFRAKIVTAVYLQFAVWCTTLTTWFGNRGEKTSPLAAHTDRTVPLLSFTVCENLWRQVRGLFCHERLSGSGVQQLSWVEKMHEEVCVYVHWCQQHEKGLRNISHLQKCRF